MDYKYDIAISFAEEDRNAALALALAFEMEGLTQVYYYPLNYRDTWGEDLKKKLDKIYSTEARYAVVLLSEWYLAKPLASLEMDAINKRIKSMKDTAYMLPVVLNTFPLDEHPEFTKFGYIEWNYRPKEIAAILRTALGKTIEQIKSDKVNIFYDYIVFNEVKINYKNMHIGDRGTVPLNKRPKKIKIEKSEFEGDFFHLGDSE